MVQTNSMMGRGMIDMFDALGILNIPLGKFHILGFHWTASITPRDHSVD